MGLNPWVYCISIQGVGRLTLRRPYKYIDSKKDADFVIGLPDIGSNDLANPHLDVAEFLMNYLSLV